MEFFKSLHCNAMNFCIVLIPFEAFDMVYCNKGHGLCLCGLGIYHYWAMGCSLFTVLQQLPPSSDMYICSQLESVTKDSCNGFELLWMLQKRYITMFDLTKEPSWLDWHSNIFRYAKRVLMHCNLSRHRSTKYSDAQCSLLFFQGLQGWSKDISVAYASMVLTHQLSYTISISFCWLRHCLTSTRVLS
jgi:hypothetical protein